jgi:Glucosyl transferase GtrII
MQKLVKIPKPAWLPNLTVLLALVVCEAIWFGPIIGKIGFYLDDWVTFSELANVQQNWQSLLQICLNDGRIAVRPLEAFVFVGSWFAFHDQPWGHHLLNCGFEVLAAFFLYLALGRLSGNRSFSFIVSLLMLVYPSHDSTHYWVVANSITLGLALYLLSLWQAIKAVQDQKPVCFLFSSLAFLASLFTYESFLPLILATAVCVLSLYKKKYNSWLQSCLKSIVALSPSLIAVLSIYYYQRIFLHQMQKGLRHAIAFSMPHMLEVLKEGFLQTLFTSGFFTCVSRTHDAIDYLNVYQCCLLAILIIVIALTLFVIGKDENRFFRPYIFMGLGILIMILAYTIFGISPEYMPKLESILNRTNMGAAVGASIFISGLLCLLLNRSQGSRAANCALLTIMVSPIIIFFVLADWGWSIPWIQSWTFQKYVIHLVKEQTGRFSDQDSIILAHTPRYVMWSPLFDGVWDFQAMLRMYLNAPNIKGGVVSDRMILSKDAIKDISMGYLCGSYPYSHLFVFIPNPKQWIAIHSAGEFITAIQSHGLGFGLTDSIISCWRKELLSSNNNANNHMNKL